MKNQHRLLAALALAVPAAAFADSPFNYVAGYFNHSSRDGFGGGSGNGYGVRASGQVMEHAFVYGEYQSTSFDTGADDGKFARLGGGFSMDTASGQAHLALSAEFVHAAAGSDSDNGYGLHGGAIVHILDQLDAFGEVGYVEVGKSSGPEYRIGAVYEFLPQWGAFAAFRRTDFGNASLGDLTYNDVQVGVRFDFGDMLMMNK